MAGSGIDQARRHLAAEGVIETGLVTRNTRRDVIGLAGHCFTHELRICEERPRHGHHIRGTAA